MQRVFKWGVGNEYMRRNRLRYLPPTLPRPKTATVPGDYFQAPSNDVTFDDVNEQWEVRWFQHGKMHGKPFPVKKFGVLQAKTEALVFRDSLRVAGDVGKPQNKSEVTGVFWDERTQAWFARYTCSATGSVRTNGYSADKWGFEGARRRAEDKVRKAEAAADSGTSLPRSEER